MEADCSACTCFRRSVTTFLDTFISARYFASIPASNEQCKIAQCNQVAWGLISTTLLMYALSWLPRGKRNESYCKGQSNHSNFEWALTCPQRVICPPECPVLAMMPAMLLQCHLPLNVGYPLIQLEMFAKSSHSWATWLLLY